MNIFLLIVVGIFLLPGAYGQKKFDPLLKKGIEYHDAKQYDQAIGVYERILREDSTVVEAQYELSLSLLESGRYEEAIVYCNKLTDREDKYAILGYNTKGSCLNYLGKPDEAIAVYLEGIERYESLPQLHYNLGLTYFGKKEYAGAKEAYLQTLALNPKHAGAHLNLGRTMAATNKRIESLLGLYYFLLLEPATDRSEVAYNLIQQQLYDLNESDSDYKKAETRLLSLLEENERQITETGSTFNLFIQDTNAVFSLLEEIDEQTDPAQTTVWDNYISFFKTLAARNHTGAFCYYISPLAEKEAWRKQNETRLTNFARWLAQQE